MVELKEIADLFNVINVTFSNISLHINNILRKVH